jgi:uncharacterized protein
LRCYLIGCLFLKFSERRLGMPNGTKDGLDRRDFMILALGSVAATAAASVNAEAATTQDAAMSSLAPGTGAQQGTVYTGDVIQGKKVVSALDINDLEPGKHLFYFQGVQMPAGQHWYVSVIVVKGATHRPYQRCARRRGQLGPHDTYCHEPTRPCKDVWFGSGSPGCIAPGS